MGRWLIPTVFGQLTHRITVFLLFPLAVAGFICVAAAISLIRHESIYPNGPLWGMKEPWATAVLGLVALLTPIFYPPLLALLSKKKDFLGLRQRMWKILAIAAFLTGVVVAGIFAICIFLFTKS